MAQPKILQEAVEELDAAAAFLEAERAGTAKAFLQAFESAGFRVVEEKCRAGCVA